MICQYAKTAFSIRGFARAPIRDLRLIQVVIKRADQIGLIEHVDGLYLEAVTVNNAPLKR
jgi:hypothetical protein